VEDLPDDVNRPPADDANRDPEDDVVMELGVEVDKDKDQGGVEEDVVMEHSNAPKGVVKNEEDKSRKDPAIDGSGQ
jgi:hypothetical protein